MRDTRKDRDLFGARNARKSVLEIGSAITICIPSLMQIVSSIQKIIRVEYTDSMVIS
jgi:hypothetical protein